MSPTEPNPGGVSNYAMLFSTSQDLEYLEGSIKEFPQDLKQQIESEDSEKFARALWKSTDKKPQSLEYRDGYPTEFVRKDDQKMQKLSAGRFRFRWLKQIVVVGLPNARDESGVRYVIAARPPGDYDLFTAPTGLPENCKRSVWYIWKPKGHDEEYYEGVPDSILRIRYENSSVGKQDNDDTSIPADTVTSLPKLSEQNAFTKNHAIAEQQPASPTPDLTANKRKLSFMKEFYMSSTTKRLCGQDEECERLASAPSISNASVVPDDRSIMKESDSTINGLSRIGRLTTVKQESACSPAPNESQKSESFDSPKWRKSQCLTSEDVGNGSGLPGQDPVPDYDTVATTLLPVKQDVAGVDSHTSPQTISVTRERSLTVASAKVQSSKVKSEFVPSQLPPPRQTPANASRSTSDTPTQNTPIVMIDLTGDDGHVVIPQVSIRRIDVIFVDEYGQKQHTMPFEDCNTGADMFEEACAWRVADKHTKMLEIRVAGLEPVCVRKNNEKHFAQLVFEPMKNLLSGLTEGQSITLTVQKYM